MKDVKIETTLSHKHFDFRHIFTHSRKRKHARVPVTSVCNDGNADVEDDDDTNDRTSLV